MAGMIRYRGYMGTTVRTETRTEIPEDRTSVPPPPTYEMAKMDGGKQPILQLPPLKDRTMFPI